MIHRGFICSGIVLSLSAWCATNAEDLQRAASHPDEPAQTMVSLPSLTPLENRVKPMSLRERQLLAPFPDVESAAPSLE